MLHLKVLRSDSIIPFSGFWLGFLWIFGFGIKNETDKQGSYIMISAAIWRLETHFTLSLSSK